MSIADDYAAALARIEAEGPAIDAEEMAELVRSMALTHDGPPLDALGLACAVARLAALESVAAEMRRALIASAPVELVREATALMERWNGGAETQH